MSFAALACENRTVNAFSVVPHAQSELFVVVADFHFYLPRLGMPKGIPQRLGGDLVDLVTKNRMQISGFALN